MNLLKETLYDIEKSGHTVEDITFIGSLSGYDCTWDEFKAMADRDYDSGYGAAEVAHDLIIVFSDGVVMRRGEYDGSEWWEYQEPFVRPENTKPITGLFAMDIGAVGWVSLKDIEAGEYL